MKKAYELTTEYDARQSFYRKAFVHEGSKGSKLQSYDTIIAKLDNETKKVTLLCHMDDLSNTTMRHLREWLKQNNLFDLAGMSKQKLIKELKKEIKNEKIYSRTRQ